MISENAAFLARCQADLDALDAKNRRRELRAAAGLDFSSNDYLGFADHPALRAAMSRALEEGAPLGAGGSRLLRGNHPAHEQLEAKAAEFFGHEGALFFSSGYLANFALMTCLPARSDFLLFDELIHASLREGVQASAAKHRRFPHNDPDAAAREARRYRENGGKGQIFLVLESVYSMDGDVGLIAAFADVAARHDAVLIVDEAHATGVFGPNGRGVVAALGLSRQAITVHTCGKGLGVSGALVCAPAIVIDFLLNHARAFIYSTAPAPVIAAGVSAALDLLQREPHHQEQLKRLVSAAGRIFQEKCNMEPSGSQIMPLIVGADAAALRLAGALQDAGYDIRAIRPPTVPEGAARVRISLNLHHGLIDIEKLAGIIGETDHVA